jgi:hypothetical protein
VAGGLTPGMTAGPARVAGRTGQHARHAAAMFRQGRNPAARVYESIGPDFFLALAPGWLNLGLWEGPGSEDEAEQACRRLVRTLASVLRPGGVLSISDIAVHRWPVRPAELLSGLTQLRVFGLRPSMAMTAGEIAAAARAVGLVQVGGQRVW